MKTERKHLGDIMSFWCNGNRNWNRSKITSWNWIHTWKIHGNFDIICWKHTISISIRHDNVFISHLILLSHSKATKHSQTFLLRNMWLCVMCCVCVLFWKWIYLDRLRLLVCIIMALNVKSSPYDWNQYIHWCTFSPFALLVPISLFPTCCTYSNINNAHTHVHSRGKVMLQVSLSQQIVWNGKSTYKTAYVRGIYLFGLVIDGSTYR